MKDDDLERLWQCHVRVPLGWKREVSADTPEMLNQPVIRRWISTKEGLIDFCKAHEGRAIYVDIYVFNKFNEDGNPADDSAMFGDFCMDIEAESLRDRGDGKVERVPNLELSWEAVREIVKILLDFGVTPQNIWISFSGRRGFHTRVPIVTFLYKAELENYLRTDLNVIYHELAEKIKERLPEDLRDAICSSPYSHRRLFRLENTQHPLPPNLYCVPLPIGASSLSIDEVLEMAKEPQPIRWDVESLATSKKATEFLLKIVEEHERKMRPPTEPAEMPILEEEWTRRPCIKVALKAIQETKELHWLGRTQITSLAILAGWTDNEIVNLFRSCRDFNERKTREEISRIRRKIESPRKEGEVLLIRCDQMREGVWPDMQKDFRMTGKLPPEVFCDPDNCSLITTEIKLSEVTAKVLGKRCRANALISGVGPSYKIPIYVEITCQVEEGKEALCGTCPYKSEPLRDGLWSKEQLLLIGATEATQKARATRFLIQRKLREREKDPHLSCLNQRIKDKKLREPLSVKASWGTITECYALDAVEELKVDEKAAAPRMVKMYVARTPPVSGSKMTCVGTVSSLYRTGQLAFVASEVTPVQEATETFDLEKEKLILEKMRGQNPKELAKKVANALGLVQRENAVLATLLTYHSPLYINYAGKMIPGWLTTELYGPTRTAKSESVKGVRKLCEQGIYVTMETAGRTGLLFTTVQTSAGWILLWGELVFGDRGLVIIDGSNKMEGEGWIEFRESRSDGLVKVRKAARGDAWMRTRLVMIRNPEEGESFDEYLYKIQAVKEAYQPPDIARCDIYLPVDIVPIKEIVNRPIVSGEEKAEISQLLGTSVLWAWSRKSSDIEYISESVKRIKEWSKKFYVKYEDKEIPIVSSDVEYKLAKLSAAWATLAYNVDETHKKVIVTPENVDEACGWFDEVLQLNELDRQVTLTRRTTTLPEKEKQEISTDIGSVGQEIVKILAQEGYVQRDALASYLEIEKKALDYHIPKLKKHGLIGSRRPGYYLKSKGKKLAKHLLATSESSKEEQPSALEKIENIKQWILENRRNSVIDALKLSKHITTLGLQPTQVIEKLRVEGFLYDVPQMGKIGVRK